jgi:hypothetical protein
MSIMVHVRRLVIYTVVAKITKKSFMMPKDVVRSRNSKDRQYSGQKNNNESTNIDLHNTTWKTKLLAYVIP